MSLGSRQSGEHVAADALGPQALLVLALVMQSLVLEFHEQAGGAGVEHVRARKRAPGGRRERHLLAVVLHDRGALPRVIHSGSQKRTSCFWGEVRIKIAPSIPELSQQMAMHRGLSINDCANVDAIAAVKRIERPNRLVGLPGRLAS